MNSRISRDRLVSALAVAAFHALLGYALLTSLGIGAARRAADTLKLFDIAPEPPSPPPPVPPAQAAAAPEAAAAPPAPKAQASPVEAPSPQVRLHAPAPLVTAATAGTGAQASQGGGGAGSGTGAGDSGGSGSGGAATKARQIAGELSGRDYPRSAKRARAGGTVLIRYMVGVDGRPSGCTITQSSGNRDLDETTCRLIEQRFRYEPARDAEGRPVPDMQAGRHIWWTEPKRRRYPFEWEPEDRGLPSSADTKE